MTDPETVLTAYTAAWCERDDSARLRLLESCWAEDGLYLDPTGEARGHAALSAHIGGVLATSPGARIEMTSRADTHHDRLRFGWRMVAADGSVPVEGIDCGRIGADGRLTEIVGFFGAAPPPR